jgi:carboxyl-terminal processing protease
MTRQRREYLAVGLIIVLALLSFGAGFLFNDAILSPGEPTLVGDESDFNIFWDAWNFIENNYIGEIPAAKQITYGAMRGSVDTLGDPYTIFIEPEVRDEERERFRGNFGGIGATLHRNEEGDLILTPISGNPAEKAGVLAGDILVTVDGTEINEELTVEEIAELIRGEEGTEVVLTVIHPGEEEAVEITIVRATILLPSVSHMIMSDDTTIGYIQLSRFSSESAGEISEAVEDLKSLGARKLILDLRHNPGGLLNAAVEVSDLFLSGGPVLIQISSNDDERVFEATDETIAENLPMVVLIDEVTASSSEIVAGALQDRGRASLIGAKTFGKGSVQLVHDLSDGSSIHVTSSRWFTPNRRMIDQHGLEPDILVEPSQEDIDNGRDVVLDRAIKHLNGN